jgi:hypothetical protein
MVLSPVPDLPWLRTAEGEVAYSTTCLHTTRAFSLILKGIGTIRKFGMSVNPYRHLGVIQQTLRETPLSAESFAQSSRASAPLVPPLFVR